MLVEIIPETKSYKSDSFSYCVPSEFHEQVSIGSIVTIPFGKQKIKGVVRTIKKQRPKDGSNEPYKIKDIVAVEGDFTIPVTYFPIIDWIADHYLCTHGEALSMFLPIVMKRPPKSKELRDGDTKKIKKLSDSQASIYSEIIQQGSKKPHLIYGVTGSGKTEIYIHLCKKVLDEGKSVVVLVPEIILTPQTIERFTEAFGDNIALVHSNLSQGEKYLAYRDFSSGKKRIVIGPRSAQLIPNENIGLIIVDEEHEDAYKQDQSPRYHAVDLAEKIAGQLGAYLVLGSATPRIESYFKAKSSQYILHELKSRYNKLLLPPAEIIDLRNELRAQNNSIISTKLREAIATILKRKKQAILFLNRRGSSTFVSCRECGMVVKCPNCDIPLIHHAYDGSFLYCHHCDFRQDVPTVCSECDGVKIKFFGAGVEKVESQIKNLFPEARVRRIDAETIKSKSDYENFYHDFKDHKFDIAIGTQMITKGLDLPHVDLVGIISADTGLHMPYFRASEKIFRLVTQVSGRSGRSADSGQTIIQTYWPGSSAIQFAAQHDFEAFYEHEVQNRKKHNYPPFCELIRIVSEHEKPERARAEIEKIALELDNIQVEYPEIFEYIGPGLCFFQRIRGRWRYHIIIKLKDDNGKQEHAVREQIRELWRGNLNFTWDVDPTDLL